MFNLWFYGAAPPQQCLQLWRQAQARAADQHFCRRYTVAAIAAVHDGQIRSPTGQDRDLLQGFGQSVPIVGIARQGAHADDEALVDGSSQADLGPELIALAGLAFGDAVDLGFMQGVNLAMVLWVLMQQATDEHDEGQES